MRVKDYSGNPLKYLWKTNHNFLPNYLWGVWLVISSILFVLNNKGYINQVDLNTGLLAVLSFIGIGVILIILPHATASFSMHELELLLESDAIDERQDNQFLDLYSPYMFTLLVFVLTGTISLVSGYISIKVTTDVKSLLKITHILLMILGIFGLFNIAYEGVNDRYYAVERSRYVRELNKRNLKENIQK